MPPFNYVTELKKLDLDGVLDPDQLVGYAAFARLWQGEYTQRNLPIPEWLDDKARELSREIARRNSDQLQARLKAIEAQQAALMTPAEKREALVKEKEAILAAMGAGVSK